MRSLTQILFLIFSISVNAQSISEYEKQLNIEPISNNAKEIRVYKKYAISTGLELFIFYFDDSSNKYKAEYYYVTVDKKNNKLVKKLDLESIYNMEFNALNLFLSHAKYLPSEQKIWYKFIPKPDIFIEDGYIYHIIGKPMSIIDGISYSIQIQDNDSYNEVEYSNPESYLKNYPEIDELQTINEFLDFIKSSFGIYKN
ncbi:hypothetical protein EG240_08600 [Paenimyroides tangerinum]|uniref:GLPGLI family protein n=1 Tax=Paenimyroides tangerinum TaxID=2488728 RepID=A0A3P3W8B1_9FLAO|nr:hypothetical protein [Paenimyroides tangerinum]RRJ90577.1 hypothetical protein EG240_08600 [Paenimyroides tangerinum]